jgi:hypothetical protein
MTVATSISSDTGAECGNTNTGLSMLAAISSNTGVEQFGPILWLSVATTICSNIVSEGGNNKLFQYWGCVWQQQFVPILGMRKQF